MQTSNIYFIVLLFFILTPFLFSQEIVGYINRALDEKKLLYFGMENLDFSFTDPVSTEANEHFPAPQNNIHILMIALRSGPLDSGRCSA